MLQVDANDVGDGEPVVRVDGGKVPCELKKIDRRKYRASFVPRKPGKYLVDVQFYDEDIPGNCEMHDLLHTFFVIRELTQSNNHFLLSMFDSDTGINLKNWISC